MPTIVQMKDSKAHAILIGVGYGMFRSSHPSPLLGNLFASRETGDAEMAAISTASGEILWCHTDDLTVVSVDGIPPHELLAPHFLELPKGC